MTKKALYLGLDPSRFEYDGEIVHLPVIKIVPRTFDAVAEAFNKLAIYTDILLTSRAAAKLFIEYARYDLLHEKNYLVVGNATAELLKFPSVNVAKEACGEGVVQMLKENNWKRRHLFYPKSALSRSLIEDHLIHHKIAHTVVDLYTTTANDISLPDLREFDEFIFTSPSTVNAFAKLVERLPPFQKCRAIGPITQHALERCYFLQ